MSASQRMAQRKDLTIPLYLFSRQSERQTLRSLTWTGKVVYKSTHESHAVDCMCEIKEIDSPNRDEVR